MTNRETAFRFRPFPLAFCNELTISCPDSYTEDILAKGGLLRSAVDDEKVFSFLPAFGFFVAGGQGASQ